MPPEPTDKVVFSLMVTSPSEPSPPNVVEYGTKLRYVTANTPPSAFEA